MQRKGAFMKILNFGSLIPPLTEADWQRIARDIEKIKEEK